MSDEKQPPPPEGTLWDILVHLYWTGLPGRIGETTVTISATTHVSALCEAILAKFPRKLKGRDAGELVVRLMSFNEPLECWTKLYSVFEGKGDGTRRVFVEVAKEIADFTERPPLNLNGATILFDREDSAFQLAEALLSPTTVPIMDQLWKAGKTSLVWRFREFLPKHPERMGKLPSARLKDLMSAVYLHVTFLPSDFGPIGELKENDFDAIICRIINRCLESSGRRAREERVKLEDIIEFMESEEPGTRFLFHFDDLDVFGIEAIETRLLAHLFLIAEQLRRASHFCMFSGRSSLLQRAPQCVPIALPLLSEKSIANMFGAQGLQEWISRNKNLSSALILTGGIPSACQSLLAFVERGNFLDLQDDSKAGMAQTARLHAKLQLECRLIPSNQEDIDRFNLLLEMSWGQIEIPTNKSVLGKPLSKLLLELGLCPLPGTSADMCKIVVPLYLICAQSFIPRSLCAISEYEGAGSGLEAGFRRVLHLRLCSLEGTQRREWSAVGLPFLDEQNIPFPPTRVEQCFAFPKIGDRATGTQKEAAECMQKIHEGRPTVESSQEFAPRLLPELFAQLELSILQTSSKQ